MKWLAQLGISSGIASRYVAGMNLHQALPRVKRLNNDGLLVTLDALGENVKTKQEAREAVKTYKEIIHALAEKQLDSGISIKLTMLGLDLGDAYTLKNTEEVLKEAKKKKIFVRIDMEGSPYTQKTLDIFYKLRKTYTNVGIVVQAMLYRTRDDVKKLAKVGAPVRLVKGAYKETPDIAYPKKEDVNNAYVELLQTLLLGKGHVAIATHDKVIIKKAKSFIKKKKISKKRYEFQMLYGIQNALQHKLSKEGENVRTYVPYGENYIPYFYRRIRERKENFFFLLKNLI